MANQKHNKNIKLQAKYANADCCSIRDLGSGIWDPLLAGSCSRPNFYDGILPRPELTIRSYLYARTTKVPKSTWAFTPKHTPLGL